MALVQPYLNPVSRIASSIIILFGTVIITQGHSGRGGNGEVHVEWDDNRYVLPGAKMTKKADRPFQVMVTDTDQSAVIGSGALYNDKWIIIPAHMLFDETGKSRFYHSLRFTLGKRDMSDHDAGEEIFSAQDIVIHPDFTASQLGNDIALVRLKSEVAYTDTIKQIALAQAGSAPNGQVSVSGWGYSKHEKIDIHIPRQRSKSKYMQIQEQSIVPLGECIKNYTDYEINSVFKIPPVGQRLWKFKEDWPIPTNTTLCATASKKDVCLGESGSPLTCSGGELCGILSHGMGCSVADLPSIYTDISQFSTWVQKVAGKPDGSAPEGSNSTAGAETASNSGSTGDGQTPAATQVEDPSGTGTGDSPANTGPGLIPITAVTPKPMPSKDGKNCTKSPGQPEVDESTDAGESAAAKSEKIVDYPEIRSVRENKVKGRTTRYSNIKPGRKYRIVDGRITKEWDAPKNGRTLQVDKRVEKPKGKIASQSVNSRADQKIFEFKNARRRFQEGPVGNSPNYGVGRRYTANR